jgi:hypothetical protein
MEAEETHYLIILLVQDKNFGGYLRKTLWLI